MANPNCEYDADIRIVFAQDDNSLTGSFTLTVTPSTQLLNTNVPCVPVTTSNNEVLLGSVNSSNMTFELFASRIEFGGTFTSDILTATFASTLPGGIAGSMTVQRQ